VTARQPKCRGSHVYGTRDRCLRCDYPAPLDDRSTVLEPDIEKALRARPVVTDIAGWDPEEGDPWT
jgi:hypothetical protein